MAVFLIPGLWGTKKYYEPAAAKFAAAGINLEIIDLGRNFRNLKKSSEIVIRHLKSTDEKDDIIAHSYGGIILKYILRNYPDVLKMIRSITFVAVPHGGTWPALLIAMLPAARELLPFRKHLLDFQDLKLPESTVNFISQSEVKIWPRKNALLKGYVDIAVAGTNHDNIIFSDDFVRRAVAYIRSGGNVISIK